MTGRMVSFRFDEGTLVLKGLHFPMSKRKFRKREVLCLRFVVAYLSRYNLN
jgi:hypothetical protein